MSKQKSQKDDSIDPPLPPFMYLFIFLLWISQASMIFVGPFSFDLIM